MIGLRGHYNYIVQRGYLSTLSKVITTNYPKRKVVHAKNLVYAHFGGIVKDHNQEKGISISIRKLHN